MDLEETVRRYRDAANQFATGDPDGVKALYSRADDVMLANPFGPAVRGWAAVSDALDRAAGSFRDGAVTAFERMAEYVGDDVASIHETEQWQAKVAGRPEVSTFTLRATSTFRREEGTWKLVLRHADPISAADPLGPLRTHGA
jgi:ketosteroid isomerase-like protein